MMAERKSLRPTASSIEPLLERGYPMSRFWSICFMMNRSSGESQAPSTPPVCLQKSRIVSSKYFIGEAGHGVDDTGTNVSQRERTAVAYLGTRDVSHELEKQGERGTMCTPGERVNKNRGNRNTETHEERDKGERN